MTISDIANPTAPAMTFYGKMLTFSRLQISTNNLSNIEAQLANMLDNKDSNIPVIIDSDIEQNLPELVELLWSWGLQPIGVVRGLLDEQARAQRLAIFPADGKRIERILPSKKTATQLTQAPINTSADTNTEIVSEVQSKTVASVNNSDDSIEAKTASTIPNDQAMVKNNRLAEAIVSADEHITSLIYDQMLRSGQSLNHVGGDLILTNSVNSGAEAITDNNLHVYGRAQGRLVAGATGDREARIFCQVFNPSLVSVAGTYCLRDNLPKDIIDKPVQVRFVEGQGLVFKVIDES